MSGPRRSSRVDWKWCSSSTEARRGAQAAWSCMERKRVRWMQRYARVCLKLRQLLIGRVGHEVRGARRQARRRTRADREGEVGHHTLLYVGDAPLGASLVYVELKVVWSGGG